MILEIDLGSGFQPVACLLSYTEDESTEVLGTTTRKNLRWRTSVGHYQTKTISGNGLFVEEAGLISYNQLRQLLWAGTRFEWRIEDDDGFGFLRSLDLGVPEGDDVNFSFSIQVDGNPEIIDQITAFVSAPVPTQVAPGGGPVDFIVTYTNADTITLAPGDITLSTSGTATAGTIQIIDIGPEQRIVRLSNISGSGTIGFFVASGTARNSSGGVAPSFASNQVLQVQPTPITITIDPPVPLQVSGNGSGQANWLVTFNNADLVTLGQADINIIKTGTADGAALVFQFGPANERTVRITGITGVGTLSFDFPAGKATNTQGAVAPAGGPSQTVSVIPPPPSGYSLAWDNDPIGDTTPDLTLSGGNGEGTAITGAITSSGGGSPVNIGTIPFSSTPFNFNVDVSSLPNGTLFANLSVVQSTGPGVQTFTPPPQTTKNL